MEYTNTSSNEFVKWQSSVWKQNDKRMEKKSPSNFNLIILIVALFIMLFMCSAILFNYFPVWLGFPFVILCLYLSWKYE